MFTKTNAYILASLTSCSLLFWGVGCSQNSESNNASSEKASASEKTMSKELTENQKIHRTLGYSIGSDLMLETYSADEVEQILAGLGLAAGSEKPEYVDSLKDQAFQILNAKASQRSEERQDSAITDNKSAGEAFLKTVDAKEGIIKTDSGLRYEMLTEGSDKYATSSDSVQVHYHGTLIDGTVFDSSVERGEPVTFPLNGVIAGFSEGLTLVGEGGKIRLYMPSNIAYGDRGAGGAIGPGASLVFEVELLKINP
jgi:FKBP-type peptidyl-prolyl cis-trans isomerase FklB